jgi:hypothetical protein
MKVMTLIVAFFMAGCAYMPQEVVEAGIQHRFSSRNAPKDAARCIERNAENRSAAMLAQQRPLDAAGAVEVIARGVGEVATTMAVARLRPMAGGSEVTIWTNPNILSGGDNFAAMLFAGC